LEGHGFESFVVVPEAGPLVRELQERHIEVEIVPYLCVIRRGTMRSWRLLSLVFMAIPSVIRLWVIIRERGIDVVHSNTATTFTPALAARLAGVPHVWHLREMFADDFPVLWRLYRRFMTALSDRVLCVSTAIREQLPPNSRAEVLHNGVDLSEFEPENLDVLQLREGLCRGTFAFLIGVASRISPWKGQDVFIEACGEIVKRRQDVCCLVIGDTFPGNEYLEERLKIRVSELGLDEAVVFTGFIEDPRPLIAALDVLVLPSTRPDPFPGVILEAMALGVPVVASGIGGPTEQVDDGMTGLLVPPGDPTALANCILELLSSPDRLVSMGKNARNRVRLSFSIEAMSARLGHLYRELKD
jgi:glycosyltransferase involved in cell wall biosynthesis